MINSFVVMKSCYLLKAGKYSDVRIKLLQNAVGSIVEGTKWRSTAVTN
jgi:hypothetical protein